MDGDTFGTLVGEFRTGEDCATGILSCRTIGGKGSIDAIGSAILLGVGARNRPKAGGHGPQLDAVNRPFEIQLPPMDMPRYGFVLLAALLGIAGLIASYCRAQSSTTKHKTKHSKWDYLLVWPLILKRGSTTRGSKILSAREFIAWGVVVILILAAVVFRW
jgi:hypothetical protein